jgi:hypothetical protein
MGMLFDHGCDALTTMHFTFIIQRMLQIGNGPLAIGGMMISTFPFYYISLEEFYSGILVMPAFTGPDDASLAILVVSLGTAYFGSEEIWGSEVDFFGFGNMRLSHLFGYVLGTWSTFSCIFNVCTNLWNCRQNEHFLKRYKLSSFIAHCTYMFVLCAVFIAYIYTPGSLASTVYTKSTMFAFGVHFV